MYIEHEIAAYEHRIQRIQARLLGELHADRDTKQTRYKRRKQRKELGQQIAHVRGLIQMAEKALPGGKWHSDLAAIQKER